VLDVERGGVGVVGVVVVVVVVGVVVVVVVDDVGGGMVVLRLEGGWVRIGCGRGEIRSGFVREHLYRSD
jgi:hypothetical protein